MVARSPALAIIHSARLDSGVVVVTNDNEPLCNI